MAEFQKDHRGTIWRWIIKALSMKKEHQFKSLSPPLFQLEHLGKKVEFQKDHRGTIWRWIIKALSMKKEHQFKSLSPPLFQLEHLGNLLKQFFSKWFILRLFAACCQFSEWLPETSTMDVGC